MTRWPNCILLMAFIIDPILGIGKYTNRNNQVGAGIQIPPNSTRLLQAWGIERFFDGLVIEPESMTFRRWENGEPIGYTRLVPDFQDSFGSPYYVIHRAHFHSALCKLANSLGVEIITNSRVVSYDEDVPNVETMDGRIYTADLIVAADGVKSLARSVVLGGNDIIPNTTGFAAYRAVVDTAMMRTDPDTAELLERPGLNIWLESR
jgi:salicylate hydroxylase